MPVDLRRVPLPDFGAPAEPPEIPPAEYEARARSLRRAVGTDWVAVYGDREHTANLLFLSGFDPRFEEALLLFGPDDRRLLVVGNEGLIHAAVARLPVEVVLYQGFSLMGQPRGEAPRLDAVLRDAGLAPGQRVGVAGWKYLEASETDDPAAPAFVPAFVVDAIRRVAATDPVDVTAALMH
ncbi:MAG: Xaa-Pro aminopeptidase, partial [Chloroflexota bacterium]|nr:Xaa-Pro aminopeptidase [Chloroflexota bacterium]